MTVTSTPLPAERSCLLIRADASEQIGAGHVMRCIALAQAWQDIGGTAQFACHRLSKALLARLNSESIPVNTINADPGTIQDASEFSRCREQILAAAIVVDGYQFDQDYIDAVAQEPTFSVLLDDYGQITHYNTDLILNQNPGVNSQLYDNRSSQTQLLQGPNYALLRREIRSATTPKSIDKKPCNLLVTLGGSDPNNLLPRVITELSQIKMGSLRCRILLGGIDTATPTFTEMSQSDNRFQLIPTVKDMAEQYHWADLAIAAGGSSNWEMCLFGLPRIVIVTAENQTGVARHLRENNIAEVLGRHDTIKPSDIRKGVLQLIGDPTRRMQLAENSLRLIDGLGAQRVANAIKNGLAKCN